LILVVKIGNKKVADPAYPPLLNQSLYPY